jgi:uncharacterized repeat protein (TIGR03803 family)
MLAGCGGSQPPIGAPGAMPQSYENPGHSTGVVETVIYSFSGGTGSMGDGVNPSAGLINESGTLYGTTFFGGFYNNRFDKRGRGTVFSVTPSGKEIVLHRFTGPGDGKYPYAGLLNVDGIMYGTTEGGGARGFGTVFSITPNGTEAVLHHFKGYDGAGPQAGLTNLNGALYGTTQAGGSSSCDYYGCGTIFKITLSGKESVLHSFGFNRDGKDPFAGLVNVKGTLYGTTAFGGAHDDGIVFAITPSGKETILHSFKGGASDGAEPWAGLVDVNGTLYGTTVVGGGVTSNCKQLDGCGTVFSITPSGKERLLHSFGASGDGGEPEAALLNVNGNLYGTTYYGGTQGAGTVFSITPSGTETVLYSFATKNYDGLSPQAGLINVKGTLYGTTEFGGVNDDGAVYSLSGI